MSGSKSVLSTALLAGLLTIAPREGTSAENSFAGWAGPLTVHPTNPRYFADASGKAVYLTGSHVWNSFQDYDPSHAPPFDYTAYLDFLQQRNHNFIRMWATARGTGLKSPMPYERTGPGTANDGSPKYDLDRFDAGYFDRLTTRVSQARGRGLYVSVMLFGADVDHQPGNENWPYHFYHGANNINGIDGDPDGDGQGLEVLSLQIPAITALHEALARRVIAAIDHLDNVLYEICNEAPPGHAGTAAWQFHMIRYLKGLTSRPVGMTAQWVSGSNADLFNSLADWISPNYEGGYADDPPAADGSKVILADSDHIRPHSLDRVWVWKSFARGLQPILMDGGILSFPADTSPSATESSRSAMGHTLSYANRMTLAAMTPRGDLTSTGYALASPGSEYLVYAPSGGSFIVTLAAGTYTYEWFNPAAGQVAGTGTVTATGGDESFAPPFGGDAVLYVVNAASPPPPPPPPPPAAGGGVGYSEHEDGWPNDRCSVSSSIGAAKGASLWLMAACLTFVPAAFLARFGARSSGARGRGVRRKQAGVFELRASRVERRRCVGPFRSLLRFGLVGLILMAPLQRAQGSAVQSAAAPVGHWKLDEGSGIVVADASGNGNHGSVVNQPTPGWGAGRVGGALALDGVDDYISVAHSGSLDVGAAGQSYSVALWYRRNGNPAATPVGRPIIEKNDGSSRYPFLLGTQSDGTSYFVVYDGSNAPIVNSSRVVTDDAWHHLAAVRDAAAGVLRLYVDGANGVATAADTTAGDTRNQKAVWMSLKQGADTLWYDAIRLDDVQVYNRALTASEVQALAAAQNPSPNPVPATGSTSSGEGQEGLCGALGVEWLLVLCVAAVRRRRRR